MSEREEQEFERAHGVPVRAGGSDVIARYGMGLAMLFLGIMFGAFLISYFYLRIENTAWPPPGTPLPRLAAGALSSALVLAGGLAMRTGLRGVRTGIRSRTLGGMVVALVLAGGAVAVHLGDLLTLPFGGTDHAYGSIVHALAGFELFVACATIVVTALALLWAAQGRFTMRRHVHVTNTARLWAALVAIWLVGSGTLYLGPYLT